MAPWRCWGRRSTVTLGTFLQWQGTTHAVKLWC